MKNNILDKANLNVGFLFSLILAILNSLIAWLIFPILSSFVFRILPVFYYYSPILTDAIVGAIIGVPFLLLNSFSFFIFKKSDFRRGLRLGYGLFFLIFLLFSNYANYILYTLPDKISRQNIATFENAVREGDELLCSKIINDDNYKNDCFFKFAVEKKDESICDRIIDIAGVVQNYDFPDTTKESCHQQFHLDSTKKDILLCFKITDPRQKNHCFANVAFYNSDLSICDKINDAVAKDTSKYGFADFGIKDCYQNIALNTRNISYCDKLTEKSSRDICVYEVIRSSSLPSDVSLCNGINFNSSEFTKKYERNLYCPDLGTKESCYLNAIKYSNNENLFKQYCPLIEINSQCDKACSKFIPNYQK